MNKELRITAAQMVHEALRQGKECQHVWHKDRLTDDTYYCPKCGAIKNHGTVSR